jgi:hypothetical protein
MKILALLTLGFVLTTTNAFADGDFQRALETFARGYENLSNDYHPREAQDQIHEALVQLDDAAIRCDDLYDDFDRDDPRDRAAVKSSCLSPFSSRIGALDLVFAKAKVSDLGKLVDAPMSQKAALFQQALKQQGTDILLRVDLLTLQHTIKKDFDELLSD